MWVWQVWYFHSLSKDAAAASASDTRGNTKIL